MRCHLATAMTVRTPPVLNPLQAVAEFMTRPLADGLNLADHLVAGATASAAAVSALHPMDTLKTVIQKAAPAGAATSSSATSAVAAAAGQPKSLNIVSALAATLRSGGVPALYNGLSASLAGQVPAGAIKFAAYETLTQAIAKALPGVSESPLFECGCAALAFVTASVVLVPTEVLKQRLQAGVYTSLPKAITSVLRDEGARAFYTGYTATLLRDVPYTMLEFGLYSQFKRSLRHSLRKDRLTQGQELAMGGLAGGFTGFLTTPLDLAKTRLMTQAPGAARQYSGVMDALFKVAREEGMQGLFKGSSTRVIWLIPFTAVYFGVHEASKRALRNRRLQKATASSKQH